MKGLKGMKLLPLAAVALVLTGLHAGAQESRPENGSAIRLSEVIAAVLEHNADISSAELALQEARHGWQAARAGAGPQLELDSDLISYDARRVSTGAPPGVGAPDFLQVDTLGAEPKLRGSLPLPGDGRLNIEAGAAAQRSISAPLAADGGSVDRDSEELEYSLDPYLSLQVSQPVFAGGRPIELRALSARDELARSGYAAAAITHSDLRRRLSEAAVELYGSLANLRGSVAALEFAEGLEARRLEQAELDRADGLITGRQLLQLRIGANRTTENLLDTRNALRRLERSLYDLTGGTIEITDVPLATEPAGWNAAQTADGSDSRMPDRTPDRTHEGQGDDSIAGIAAVQRAERVVLEAEMQRIRGAVDRAPQLSLFSRLEPRYPAERANPDELESAWSDLFEDSGLDWTVGLGLRFSLYDGGAARRAAKAEQAAVERARIEQQQAIDEARADASDRERRIELLRERIALLEDDVELARGTLADLETRVELGTAGVLQRDEARLDVLRAGNTLAQSRWELAVELAAAAGLQAQ